MTTLATRMTLIATLVVAFGGWASAQEAPASGETAPQTTTAATEAAPAETAVTEEAAAEPEVKSSATVRSEFSSLLRRHPAELGRILRLDPTLMRNEEFLSAYPAVARYIEQHPEIHRNPSYYLGEFYEAPPRRSEFGEALEAIMVFLTVAAIAVALGWFIRTVIEQRRWNRLSRTQTDVHTKILDRFGTSEELLAYIKTPAGSKFLESAPIPLHTERAPQTTPQNAPWVRIMWSIQLGVIIGAAAIGMLLVSLRFVGEGVDGFYVLGVIGLCIGGGFIGSAAVSILLSRRLGLWQNENDSSQRGLNEPGIMR